jgi:antitoxin MazE
MKTRLIKIGNSQGIMLTKTLLRQYEFGTEVEIEAKEEGLLLKPILRKARQGWAEQFAQAATAGETPEEALLDGFTNEFDEAEWRW